MKEENMKPENTRTIHRVINVFGAQNQKMQALEELMELQSALFENVHREILEILRIFYEKLSKILTFEKK